MPSYPPRPKRTPRPGPSPGMRGGHLAPARRLECEAGTSPRPVAWNAKRTPRPGPLPGLGGGHPAPDRRQDPEADAEAEPLADSVAVAERVVPLGVEAELDWLLPPELELPPEGLLPDELPPDGLLPDELPPPELD